jgi:hypothetical protein
MGAQLEVRSEPEQEFVQRDMAFGFICIIDD